MISNVPGHFRRQGSEPTVPSAAVGQEDTVGNVLRLVLVTRNEELERELRGLRFLLWRANPKFKAELEHMVKLILPLHHEELIKNPVEDYVVNWQAAIVSSPGNATDDGILKSDDTDSGEKAVPEPNAETESFTLAAIAKYFIWK